VSSANLSSRRSASCSGVRELAPGRVGQRLAPPGEQRIPQNPRGRFGVAVRQRAAALGRQRLEGRHVDRVRRHREAVSGRVRLDHVADPGLAQFGPQPGNQCLQRVAGIARGVVGPDLPGQRAGRHDTPGVQGEQSEQNAQLTTAYVDQAPRLVPHLAGTVGGAPISVLRQYTNSRTVPPDGLMSVRLHHRPEGRRTDGQLDSAIRSAFGICPLRSPVCSPGLPSSRTIQLVASPYASSRGRF
jgi:hypothetical protein